MDHPDYPKLKMKYIGAFEYAVPKIGKDGKIKTGFDEQAYDVLMITDEKERKEVQKRIKKEREELENLLKVSLDTSSEFWNKFYITLSDEDLDLDPANPLDRVKERFLVANRYAAPSIEDILDKEEFMNCMFYVYRETEETTKKVQKDLKLDKARGKLSLLYEENPAKLKTVAAYIFAISPEELSADKAYGLIRDGLDSIVEKDRKRSIDMFLSVADKTPEELNIKLVLDKAVKMRIVSRKQGKYRRDDVFYGNTYDEAIVNLGSVDMNNELVSLIKQVGKL